MLSNWPGRISSASPATMPASNSAVPVADRALKVKMAASGSGLTATGGTFSTAWCNQGTSNNRDQRPVRELLTTGSPQTNTNNERKIHGSHAFQAASDTDLSIPVSAVGAAKCSTAEGFFPGFQNFIS